MGADLLLLTSDPEPGAVLPALGLLSHKVRPLEPDVAALLEAGPYDALLVNDARVQGDEQRSSDPNQAGAREFVRILGEQGISVTGDAGTGTAPAGSAELATVQSQPPFASRSSLPPVVPEPVLVEASQTSWVSGFAAFLPFAPCVSGVSRLPLFVLSWW